MMVLVIVGSPHISESSLQKSKGEDSVTTLDVQKTNQNVRIVVEAQ